MRMTKVLAAIVITIAIIGAFSYFRGSSVVEDVDIEIDFIDMNVSMSQKTQKTEKGIFQFRPDLSTKPSGHIEVNFTVNKEPKSFKTEVKDIFTLGGGFLYYFYACDNGNAYQGSGLSLPFVKSMKDFKKLNLNAAKKMYKNGNIKQKELAVWMIWKISTGKDVADLTQDLVDGDVNKKEHAARVIARSRLYHPLINQAVQRRLRELKYSPGPVNGVLNDKMIKAIKQFQKDHDIESTGWLGESTLVKMFT